MGGLLSGLGELGLGNLEGMNLYDEQKKEAKDNAPKAPTVTEADFLYEKEVECPVCYEQYRVKIMKTGKAKLLRTDIDLRPVYEGIEPLKYDIYSCPHCGYSTLSRYFGGVTDTQRKEIKSSISANFHKPEQVHEIYDYDEAVGRYKLALVSAIVRHAKASEKAYICMKVAWLLRSKGENLNINEADYMNKLKSITAEEAEFIRNAADGFLAARQSEEYPMCGMDEMTIDYLIAALCIKNEQWEQAARLVSEIITSRTANNRIKDKARDLKDIIMHRNK